MRLSGANITVEVIGALMDSPCRHAGDGLDHPPKFVPGRVRDSEGGQKQTPSTTGCIYQPENLVPRRRHNHTEPTISRSVRPKLVSSRTGAPMIIPDESPLRREVPATPIDAKSAAPPAPPAYSSRRRRAFSSSRAVISLIRCQMSVVTSCWLKP